MGALRFLLAISVVCAHTGGFLGYDITGGRFAVEAFFMISGFLIQIVLEKKYAHSPVTFYSNRFLRIFPLYFCALAFTLVIYGVSGYFTEGYFNLIGSIWNSGGQGAVFFAGITSLTIFGQDLFLFLKLDGASLVFSPDGAQTSAYALQPMPPAWSISIELMFYVLAPFLAKLNNRTILALMSISLVARWVVYSIGFDFDPWTHRVFPFELFFFMAGMMAWRFRHYTANLTARLSTELLVVGLVAATLLVHPMQIVFSKLSIPHELLLYLYTLVVFLSLPASLKYNSSSTLDRTMGGLSYPIYLTHWSLMVLFDAVFGAGGGVVWGTVRTIVVSLFAIGASFALVRFIEAPIDRIRARRASALVKTEFQTTG